MTRPIAAVRRLAVAVTIAVGAFSSVAHAGYTTLDLGSLGGGYSDANGFGTVNNAGQVVGTSNTTVYVIRAFRTAPNNAITAADDLGSLGGNAALAFSVNASGQAVGSSYLADFTTQHAFRTAPNGSINAASDLGTLGGTSSAAYGINASGQTVGYSDTTNNAASHAFRTTTNGTINAASDLGTLGGAHSFAYGINASGQTVGYSYTTGNASIHAFRTTANGTINAASDIGTLGGLGTGPGSYSEAFGINNAGQVVGWSVNTGNQYHAFRTAPNANIDGSSELGTLGGSQSQAHAINAAGQVVGWSLTTNDAATHAFFVGVTGPMIDLNTLLPANSGWVLYYATGINDLGQISGYGFINGQTHAFLLSVPEPATLAALSLAGVMIRRRRRA